MQQYELIEFVLDAFAELATLHATAADAAERAWSVLAKDDEVDFQGVFCSSSHRECVPHERLVVSPTAERLFCQNAPSQHSNIWRSDSPSELQVL